MNPLRLPKVLLAALNDDPKILLLRGGLPAGVVERFVRCDGGGPAGVVDGACAIELLPFRFGVAGELAPKLKLKDILSRCLRVEAVAMRLFGACERRELKRGSSYANVVRAFPSPFS